MACLADLDSPEPRGGGGAAAPSCVPASRAAITLYSQRVYTGRFLGREVIIKERAPKKYRHPTLDAKLTHQRLAHVRQPARAGTPRRRAPLMACLLCDAQEVRCMVHCRREGLLVPSLLFVDPVRHQIFMERVPGQTVRELLFSTREDDPGGRGRCAVAAWHSTAAAVAAALCHTALLTQCAHRAVRQQVCAAMGEAVARLHDAGIVHGDLTTSNMIVRAGDQRLVRACVRAGVMAGHACVAGAAVAHCTVGWQVLIDFGLSYLKGSAEDKAVDLYVLERAFLSTHPNSQPLVRARACCLVLLLGMCAPCSRLPLTTLPACADRRVHGRLQRQGPLLLRRGTEAGAGAGAGAEAAGVWMSVGHNALWRAARHRS